MYVVLFDVRGKALFLASESDGDRRSARLVGLFWSGGKSWHQLNLGRTGGDLSKEVLCWIPSLRRLTHRSFASRDELWSRRQLFDNKMRTRTLFESESECSVMNVAYRDGVLIFTQTRMRAKIVPKWLQYSIRFVVQ